MTLRVGSVCSGIEVASVAWLPLGFEFEWFSDIASFPFRLLAEKYPRAPNLGDMNKDEIKGKFQILSNQTNLQKERYCQRCGASRYARRLFGIEWYYSGDKQWRGSSKADERGCVGCPWYDLQAWKAKFNAFLALETPPGK